MILKWIKMFLHWVGMPGGLLRKRASKQSLMNVIQNSFWKWIESINIWRYLSECENYYGGSNTLFSTMMCVLPNGNNSCIYGTGGPLVCENYYHCGIYSWNNGCKSGYPYIFTKTFDYLSWIESHLNWRNFLFLQFILFFSEWKKQKTKFSWNCFNNS